MGLEMVDIAMERKKMKAAADSCCECAEDSGGFADSCCECAEDSGGFADSCCEYDNGTVGSWIFFQIVISAPYYISLERAKILHSKNTLYSWLCVLLRAPRYSKDQK